MELIKFVAIAAFQCTFLGLWFYFFLRDREARHQSVGAACASAAGWLFWFYVIITVVIALVAYV